MTEIAASKEELEKLCDELESAVKLATEGQARIERVLRGSRQRRERIMDDLRSAGLVRD
jgi:hypothetical protein